MQLFGIETTEWLDFVGRWCLAYDSGRRGHPMCASKTGTRKIVKEGYEAFHRKHYTPHIVLIPSILALLAYDSGRRGHPMWGHPMRASKGPPNACKQDWNEKDREGRL
ncbi:unnamed protein product [Discosporangium mesarthrocarpum]